jgi:hypothetical protein
MPLIEFSRRIVFLQVTDKTRNDVQGGTLIGYEGKMKLLELSQVSFKAGPFLCHCQLDSLRLRDD